MSMTENEAKRPKVAIVGGGRNAGRTLKAHIDLLEELEAYRAIGTVEELKALKNKHIGKDNMVISSSDLMTILNSDSEELKQYKEVGTVEEFKALKEKHTPMELDEHNFQDEPHHYLCPVCRNIVSHNQNYCEECGQALEI
jgi:hypothetical protein